MLEQPNVDSAATAATSDRRSCARVTLAKLAYIHLEPDSGAIVLNVSETGLAFHAVGPVTQKGVIRFWVSLNLNQRVQASGQLVWTDDTRKTGGLRFTALSEGARQQIQKWMKQPPAPVSIAKRLAPLDASVGVIGGESRALHTATTAAAAPVQSSAPLHLEPALRQSDAQEPAPPEQVLSGLKSPGPPTPGRRTLPSSSEAPSLLSSPPAVLPMPAISEAPPEHARPFASSMYWEPPSAEVAESRPKFFRGFMAGVAACLLLAMLFLGYTYPERVRYILASVQPKSGSDSSRTPPSSPVASSPIASAPAPQGTASDSPPASALPAPVQVPAYSAPPSSGSAGQATQAPPSLDSVGSKLDSQADSSSQAASGDSATPLESQRPAAQIDSSRRPTVRPPQPSPAVVAPDEDSAADIDVAERYLQGLNGTRNPTAAAQFLWVAIQKGSSTAEVILADLYIRGDGVAKNCAQARVLLGAAADKGNADAQQKLQNLKVLGCS